MHLMKFTVTMLACLMVFVTGLAQAGEGKRAFKDYILNQFENNGTINSIDSRSNSLVIDDRVYFVSSRTHVKKMGKQSRGSLSQLKVNQKIGFSTRRNLPNPAPYKQLITHIWVMPSTQ